MGYSMRILPATRRTTARLEPSGDQSAYSTPSIISRGAPPPSGWRASMLENSKPSSKRCVLPTASSPDGETAKISGMDSFNGRDSVLPGFAEKSEEPTPSQEAE